MSGKWELKVAENMGEVRATVDAEDVVVPTKQLITDIKAQLMFIPKNFTWTVGWRTYVWHNQETGQFKDLTEEEYGKLLAGELDNNTRDGGEGNSGSGITTESKG